MRGLFSRSEAIGKYSLSCLAALGALPHHVYLARTPNSRWVAIVHFVRADRVNVSLLRYAQLVCQRRSIKLQRETLGSFIDTICSVISDRPNDYGLGFLSGG